MNHSTSQEKFIQDKLVKTEIPVLLSKLVLQGKKDEALQLLVEWGTRQKDQEAIWQAAKALL